MRAHVMTELHVDVLPFNERETALHSREPELAKARAFSVWRTQAVDSRMSLEKVPNLHIFFLIQIIHRNNFRDFDAIKKSASLLRRCGELIRTASWK